MAETLHDRFTLERRYPHGRERLFALDEIDDLPAGIRVECGDFKLDVGLFFGGQLAARQSSFEKFDGEIGISVVAKGGDVGGVGIVFGVTDSLTKLFCDLVELLKLFAEGVLTWCFNRGAQAGCEL